MKIEINLYIDEDNSCEEIEEGIPLKGLLRQKNGSILKKYAVAQHNNSIIDFHTPITEEGDYHLIPYNDSRAYSAYWHTSAHVMAQAVKRLFDVKLTIGPSIEDGFYYDMEKEEPFSDDELESISKEMKNVIKENHEIRREEISKQKAREIFGENKYKIELINEIEDDKVSVYRQGEFTDLCRGPHIISTGMIKSFKLLSVSGSYWRGDENRASLQRIYGISYPDKKLLEDYIKRYKEAKERDHRKLGRKLDIFNQYEEIGPGLIVWHPNGAIIREEIENYWKHEHIKRGYSFVRTPHIAKAVLWRESGHFDYYSENMFTFENDDEEYVIKPMNCPYHILVYNSELRSYRDLPIKLAEMGTVYRNERSGTLHGMLRVRGFTQDDAHIFCSEDQIEEEIGKVFDFAIEVMETFGYEDFNIYLSVRGPGEANKYAGRDEEWENAEKALVNNLKKRNIDYIREEGEAVFYGPKIDIKMKDALGREWQGPTIQFDFNIPKRFNVTYIGEDGEEHNVYMIHRALLGSFERFVGGLIEHYNGNFPTWLAPVQIKTLNITDEQYEYSKKVNDRLISEGFRAEFDSRNEKLSKKIRDAETQKIPYMFIIGGREVESNTVSVRHHKDGDIGNFTVDEIISRINGEIKKRR